MKARVIGALAVCALSGSAACGLVLGLEDHQAYPAEGGTIEGGGADQVAGEGGTGDGGGGGDAGDAGADGKETGSGCDGSTCGTSCVDLQTDPNNCGSCGHSCAGKKCYGGACSGDTVTALAAGASHDCALLQVGEVWCWGADDKGQILGASDAGAAPSSCPLGPCRQTPQRVPGLPAVTSIAAGGDQTCAVDGDGGVWCWGANPTGGLGHAPGGDPQCTSASGGSVPCSPPAQVAGLPGPASAVTAGQTGFACALVGGSTYCWGDDSLAQLGPAGDGGPSPTPLQVTSGASAVAAGWAHACSLSGTTASCWGSNAYGELAHQPATAGDQTCAGGTPCNATPQAIPQSGVLKMHPGLNASCFDTSGGAFCLGRNDVGQLGTTTSNTTPNPAPAAVSVTNASAIVATDLASRTACAIALTQAHCWGDDETHQTSASQQQATCGTSPCVLNGYTVSLFNVVELKTSPYVTLARTDDGKVYAWGNNGFGQLAHLPGGSGDSAGCDPAAFDGGTVCGTQPTQVVLP